jgi:hypothetical protein
MRETIATESRMTKMDSKMKKLANELNLIHSALDDALGDTDVSHVENEDELRQEHPVQWAAERLAGVISYLKSSRS